ncbi:unnamed protein product [Parajaminaea phylloscopi]
MSHNNAGGGSRGSHGGSLGGPHGGPPQPHPHASGGDHDESSTRHRLSRIAGQLGAGVAKYAGGSGGTTTSLRGKARSMFASAPEPPRTDTASSVAHTANQRLLSISQQLGGAVGSASQISRQRFPNPHLTPHTEAKQWERLPKWRDLPSEGGFHGCAWDVFGRDDQLGTLNLLTDHVRARAAREEIRTGHCISLSWPMHLPLEAAFGRRALEHTIRPKTGPKYTAIRQAAIDARRKTGQRVEDRTDAHEPEGLPLSDEEIHVNTQAGSQWDGLGHFGHFALNCFYGGRSRKQIVDGFQRIQRLPDPRGEPGPELGIQAWAAQGITGRGVLLDVWGFLTRNNDGHAPYDPATSHAIQLEDVKRCARAQGVRFRQGDVLLIRTGWTTRYYHSTPEERKIGASGERGYVGLEQGDAMLEWLWDNHFAAVASDTPALERWPCPEGATHLHETLLGMWGMPIGEMFDLESLTEHCQRTRRWTFYFSSWPLNLWGGVGSTANAGATF